MLHDQTMVGVLDNSVAPKCVAFLDVTSVVRTHKTYACENYILSSLVINKFTHVVLENYYANELGYCDTDKCCVVVCL